MCVACLDTLCNGMVVPWLGTPCYAVVVHWYSVACSVMVWHGVQWHLVPNYPVITAITEVITVVLVFWDRKRQMGGNAVILCVHLLRVVSGGNFRPPFYIHVGTS